VYRFGGIPRKEFVTISSSSSADGQLDLKKSMDALTLALNPIYSNLSMERSVGNSTIILTNVRSLSLSLSLALSLSLKLFHMILTQAKDYMAQQ
jgi:hypothetical protein